MFRLAALAAALMLSVPAWAADELKGVALVIGESKYETLSALANPSQDARAIDNLLGDLGFEVDRVLNADADELREAIDDFIESAKDADVALVYYSGHGVEVGGENYLVPTDTDFASPQKAGEALVGVGPMLDELAKVAPITIVLLDACRSDPFPAGTVIQLPGETALVPVVEQGLAAVRGPTPLAKPDVDPDSLGAVIGFAAEPGRPALDGGPGENSPYAAALLKHLSAGGFSFGDVMTMVSEEVYLKTKAQQLPWTNSSLRRVLTFAAPDDDGDADQSAIKSERRKLLLTIAGTTPATRSYVEALAGEEAVPLDALYGMLNVLGINATASEDIEGLLKTGAARLKELMATRSVAVKSDPELERLSKLAASAEDEGAIALALKYRDQASLRADSLLEDKQAEVEKLRQDMIDIAQTYADNAATAVLNFDHLHAADLFAKAYEAVKDWDAAKALDYTIKQGDALTDHGYYNIDNAALNKALVIYASALELAPRDRLPDDWAKVNGRIGQAKQGLGARLGDRALLEASIAAFNEALTVQTRDANPHEWAAIQNNLGNVLYSLGYQSDDRAMLQQAIDAFDASLQIYTPEADQVRWATVVSNRGSAMMALDDAIYAATDKLQVEALQRGDLNVDNLPEVLAARDNAVVILTKIVASVDEALAVRPKADNPLDWSMMMHMRASALADRGKLMSSPEDFAASIAAFRDVLTVHDKVRTPVQWTKSATNLAGTLRQYAVLTKDVASLDEAVDLLHQSGDLTPKESSPLDWAMIQTKLGNVLSDKYAIDGDVATADAAVTAYAAAEDVTTPESYPADWERLQLYKVQMLFSSAVPTMDRARLQRAQDVATRSNAKLAELGVKSSGFFDQLLPALEEILAALPQ
ncbi:MAG: caspase family protein [Devosia sp.]